MKEKKIVVALCGRDKDPKVIDNSKHLAEANWHENQPEGSGWFMPPYCPECEEERMEFHRRRLANPDGPEQQEINEKLASNVFRKATDHIEGYVAFNRIMDQE